MNSLSVTQLLSLFFSLFLSNLCYWFQNTAASSELKKEVVYKVTPPQGRRWARWSKRDWWVPRYLLQKVINPLLCVTIKATIYSERQSRRKESGESRQLTSNKKERDNQKEYLSWSLYCSGIRIKWCSPFFWAPFCFILLFLWLQNRKGILYSLFILKY